MTIKTLESNIFPGISKFVGHCAQKIHINGFWPLLLFPLGASLGKWLKVRDLGVWLRNDTTVFKELAFLLLKTFKPYTLDSHFSMTHLLLKMEAYTLFIRGKLLTYKICSSISKLQLLPHCKADDQAVTHPSISSPRERERM